MKTDKRHIEEMIEAYFDCTLSEEQEKELKGLLARTELTSPAIEEAKAVMGVFAAGRKAAGASLEATKHQSLEDNRSLEATKPRKSEALRARTLFRYAAGVALVFGIAALLYSNASEDVCVMYAGGEKISNTEIVLAQMNSELSAVGAIDSHIDQTIQSELQDISEAFNSIESLN